VRTSLVEGAIEVHGEDSVLRSYLSEREAARYRAFRHRKRRIEWLAGRIAAKEAVRAFCFGSAPTATAVEIDSGEDDAPAIVMTAGAVPSAEALHVSITHKTDVAAAAALSGSKVGVDVEQITASIADIAEEFCTATERALVSAHEGSGGVYALTAIWAVKEAARKAVGPHLWSMADMAIQKVEPRGRYLVCELFNPAAGRLRAVTFQNNQYCYAVSVIAEPPAFSHAQG
jgi:phosphopantetheinyl transferase (holo-ACP synthase)